MPTQFRGWSPAALDFYSALEGDNTKTFWAAHKSIYDVEVKAPFDALSDDLADEFGVLKVFRPHRDVRFSTDKSPYKTRCYAVAGGPGGESYYVELSADGLVAATGYWMMAADQLARYRGAVDDDRTGSALEDALAQVRAQHLDVEGQGLKTAPRGYRRDHPRIELLRHTSVAVLRRFDPAPWLGTSAAATHITAVWRGGASMNAWLIAHVGPSRAGHVEKSGRASRADSARPLGSSHSS